jgi:hypothetical protein
MQNAGAVVGRFQEVDAVAFGYCGYLVSLLRAHTRKGLCDTGAEYAMRNEHRWGWEPLTQDGGRIRKRRIGKLRDIDGLIGANSRLDALRIAGDGDGPDKPLFDQPPQDIEDFGIRRVL